VGEFFLKKAILPGGERGREREGVREREEQGKRKKREPFLPSSPHNPVFCFVNFLNIFI
jgi:hypothetical protein